MRKSVSAMPTINLVKKRDLWVDTFIYWTLNVGRVIIIFTEAVALIAFLSRFALDRQIIDLHEKIKQEQAIVQLLKHNEDTYRNLQDRLNLIDTLDAQSQTQTKKFFSFLDLVPDSVQINQISLSGNNIQFEVSAQSTDALSDLINNLKKNSSAASISVDRIDNKVSDATISMTVTTRLKKGI